MISTRLMGNTCGCGVLRTAEGGTSGKNSSTDQHQTQNTTGTTAENSPNVTAQDGGYQNFGTVVSGDAFTTDLNAVEKAFAFGDSIAKSLGQVYSASADAAAGTQKLNTDFLSSSLAALGAQSDAGQSANNNKTLLYLGLGIAALVAFALFFRR